MTSTDSYLSRKIGEFLEKNRSMHYAQIMEYTADPIGIMADSHGDNDLLLKAIEALQSLGAKTLIHLGDMCDSNSPHLMGRTFEVLSGHHVMAIKGNNECRILHDMNGIPENHARPEPVSELSRLPYVMNLGSIWFAHSAPYSYPTAARRPISEFLDLLIRDDSIPFSILFRGHSHRPSILEITGDSAQKIPVAAGRDIPLDRSRRYIVTVGAIMNASAVLFLPGDHAIRFISISGA